MAKIGSNNKPLDEKAERLVAKFTSYLRSSVTRQGTPLAARSQEEYIAILRQGLQAGDLMQLVRRTKTKSRWVVVLTVIKWIAKMENRPELVTTARQIMQSQIANKPLLAAKQTDAVPFEDWKKIVAVTNQMNEPYRSVMLILVTSGLRFIDMFGINRQAAQYIANGAEQVRIVQKGGKERLWVPSKIVRSCMSNLLKQDNWNRIGDVLGPDWETAYREAYKMLREICLEAKVPFARGHRYRHSVATEMYEQGKGVPAIQLALGHSSAATTQKFYVHPSPKHQQKDADDIADKLFDESAD